MTKENLEVPEVSGKTIECLRVNDDKAYGREVHLKFTDGTEVSLWITVQQNTSVQGIHVASGKVLFELEDKEAPEPQITL